VSSPEPLHTSRIGVIGDVHAEHGRLVETLAFLESRGVETIICTGDIVDGSGCPDTCVDLLLDHNVSVVRGNHDRWIVEDKARHIPDAHTLDALSERTADYLANLPGWIDIDTVAGRLLLCHGIVDNDLRKVWPGTQRMPIERSHELDDLIADREFRFVINGHMHFKTIIHFHDLTLINAGTITGQYWPGFSTIDFGTGTIDAFTFSDAGIMPSKTTELDPCDLHESESWQDTQCFAGDWMPRLLLGSE